MINDSDAIRRRFTEFMSEFHSLTVAGSIHGERLYKMAAIDLHAFDKAIWLSSIRTVERDRGHGSIALDWLCSLADKHSVPITGEAKPYDTAVINDVKRNALDNAQLTAWYERRGFKVSALYMRRDPQRQNATDK